MKESISYTYLLRDGLTRLKGLASPHVMLLRVAYSYAKNIARKHKKCFKSSQFLFKVSSNSIFLVVIVLEKSFS